MAEPVRGVARPRRGRRHRPRGRHLPAGPAQPGRPGACPTAGAPGRGCWPRREKSTPWCGSPASPATTGCSTPTGGGASRSSPASTASSCGRRSSWRPPLAGPRPPRRRRRPIGPADAPAGAVPAWPGLAGVDLHRPGAGGPGRLAGHAGRPSTRRSASWPASRGWAPS